MKKYYVVFYYKNSKNEEQLSVSNATVLYDKKIKGIDQIANIESTIAHNRNYDSVKLINWKRLSI